MLFHFFLHFYDIGYIVVSGTSVTGWTQNNTDAIFFRAGFPQSGSSFMTILLLIHSIKKTAGSQELYQVRPTDLNDETEKIKYMHKFI